MIRYSITTTDLTVDDLAGFFVGWPRPPAPEQVLSALRGSHRVHVATDEDTGRVVGFVNAISDGVLTAFVPWLEVLPGHQGRGIGAELIRRMLADLGDLYSVDLTCDDELTPFYAARGMLPLRGMGIRNPHALREDG